MITITNAAKSNSENKVVSTTTNTKELRKAETQITANKNRASEIKNRLDEIKIEIKILDVNIKKHENSFGYNAGIEWLGNKFAAIFGIDTIEDYKNRKQSLEAEMRRLEAELKSLQEQYPIA